MNVSQSMRSNSPLLDKVQMGVAVLAFRVVLDIVFIYYMNPQWSYHQLTPMVISFDPLRYAISYIVVAIAILMSSAAKSNFQAFHAFIVNVFLLVPMSAIYGFDVGRNDLTVVLQLVAMAIAFTIASVSFKNINFSMPINGQYVAVGIAVLANIYFIIYTIITGAINEISFNLDDIYLYRDEISEIIDQGLFGYLNLWTTKILNPFLLCVALYRRQWAIVAFCVAMQMYFFGITQHRQHLFFPIIIVLAVWFFSSRVSYARLYLGISVALLGILGLTLAFQLEALPALMIRRALFVPGSAMFDWIIYFSGSPHVYWSDSVLQSFITSPYNGQSIPYLVGYDMFNGLEVAFNVGLVGAGFSHAATPGVVLYAVLIGLLVSFVGTMVRNGVPAFIPAAVLIGPIRTAWADSDMLTAFISHGIIVGVAIIWLYGSRSTEAEPASEAGNIPANNPAHPALARPDAA